MKHENHFRRRKGTIQGCWPAQLSHQNHYLFGSFAKQLAKEPAPISVANLHRARALYVTEDL